LSRHGGAITGFRKTLKPGYATSLGPLKVLRYHNAKGRFIGLLPHDGTAH